MSEEDKPLIESIDSNPQATIGITRRRFLGIAVGGLVASLFPKRVQAMPTNQAVTPLQNELSTSASAAGLSQNEALSDQEKAEANKLKDEIEQEFGVKVLTVFEKYPRDHKIHNRYDKRPFPKEWKLADLKLLKECLKSIPKRFSEPKNGEELEIFLSNRDGFIDYQTKNQLELSPYEGDPMTPRFNVEVVVHELGGHRLDSIDFSENPLLGKSAWFDKTQEIFGIEETAEQKIAPKVTIDVIKKEQKILIEKGGGVFPLVEGSLSGEEKARLVALGRLEFGLNVRYPDELIAVGVEQWLVLGEKGFKELYGIILSEDKLGQWVDFIKNDIYKGEGYDPKPLSAKETDDMLEFAFSKPDACCDNLAT